MIRFHTQTGGVTLQAQQPEVNIIRVALQGFAAVCGGTQSLHTNGFDEALALPTERSARIALRTQQVIAHESGAADTVDPFAGSYFVESLTDEIEERAWELIEQGRRARRLGRGARVHPARDRGVGALLPRALPTGPGHRRRRQQVRHRHGRRRRHPQGRPGGRAAPERAPGEVQGQPRPGGRRREARGAARGRPRRRQPAAPDPRGARRRRLDRRGLQRDARRVRRVPGRRVLLGLASRRRSPADVTRAGRRGARASAEPRAHGIEGEAHPGQVGARALGARRRPGADAGVDERPGRRPGAGDRRGHRARARSASSPGARRQPGRRTRIAIELAESGFGTAVADHRRALARRTRPRRSPRSRGCSMSSDPPSDGRSPAERPAGAAGARPRGLLRQRGGPLLDGARAITSPGPASTPRRPPPTPSQPRSGSASTARSARCPRGRGLHEVGLDLRPCRDRDEAGRRSRCRRGRRVWAEHYEAGYRLARGAGIPEHVCGWLLRARERYDGAGPERPERRADPARGAADPRRLRLPHGADRRRRAASRGAAGRARDRARSRRRRAAAELDPARGRGARTTILERAAG